LFLVLTACSILLFFATQFRKPPRITLVARFYNCDDIPEEAWEEGRCPHYCVESEGLQRDCQIRLLSDIEVFFMSQEYNINVFSEVQQTPKRSCPSGTTRKFSYPSDHTGGAYEVCVRATVSDDGRFAHLNVWTPTGSLFRLSEPIKCWVPDASVLLIQSDRTPSYGDTCWFAIIRPVIIPDEQKMVVTADREFGA